jgi:hypothetical protein
MPVTDRPRHARLPTIVTVLLAAMAASLEAQAVTGRLTSSDTRAPVAGALVLLLDSTGTEQVRTLTYESGTYTLSTVVPGRYRLGVLRIGYPRWESAEISLERGQRLSLPIELPSVRVELLPELMVTARQKCVSGDGSNAVAATLWEEIRKGIQVTEAALTGGQLRFTTVTIRQRLDPSLAVTASDTTALGGTSSWPIRSVPAESLAARGFVQSNDPRQPPIYYGPDAQVLFSPSFLALHCLRFVPSPAERPERVGIGFEPVAGRRHPDIEGVLWLDRTTLALVDFEFTYTGLPRWVPKGKAGGKIEFSRLASGISFLRRWQLRAPVARSGLHSRRAKLAGYEVFAGETVEVHRRDGTLLLGSTESPDTAGARNLKP